MIDILFYIFSAVALGSALALVFSRNPVNAAMLLIVSFIGIASLFVLLESYFLAVVQVLVYAGAVVVLFVFIIMLLDVKESAQRKLHLPTAIASVIGFGIMIAGILAVLGSESMQAKSALPAVSPGASLSGFGNELFTTYLLPMQVTGFLLLISMIGVIVLSKKPKAE